MDLREAIEHVVNGGSAAGVLKATMESVEERARWLDKMGIAGGKGITPGTHGAKLALAKRRGVRSAKRDVKAWVNRAKSVKEGKVKDPTGKSKPPKVKKGSTITVWNWATESRKRGVITHVPKKWRVGEIPWLWVRVKGEGKVEAFWNPFEKRWDMG